MNTFQSCLAKAAAHNTIGTLNVLSKTDRGPCRSIQDFFLIVFHFRGLFPSESGLVGSPQFSCSSCFLRKTYGDKWHVFTSWLLFTQRTVSKQRNHQKSPSGLSRLAVSSGRRNVTVWRPSIRDSPTNISVRVLQGWIFVFFLVPLLYSQAHSLLYYVS